MVSMLLIFLVFFVLAIKHILFEFTCTKCNLLRIVVTCDYTSNMAGVLQQAGNAYPSVLTWIHHSVLVRFVLLIVVVSCVVVCCLRSVSCLSNVTDVSVLSII